MLGHPVILLPTKYLDHNIYISAKAYYYLSYALRPLLLPQYFLTLPQIFLNLISSRRKILRSAAAYYTRILYVKYHAVQCIHSYKKTSWLDGIRQMQLSRIFHFLTIMSRFYKVTISRYRKDEFDRIFLIESRIPDLVRNMETFTLISKMCQCLQSR